MSHLEYWEAVTIRNPSLYTPFLISKQLSIYFLSLYQPVLDVPLIVYFSCWWAHPHLSMEMETYTVEKAPSTAQRNDST